MDVASELSYRKATETGFPGHFTANVGIQPMAVRLRDKQED